MTRLLIAGGGHSDVPLIQAARNLGWTVATAGNRPAEPGHRYSHVFLHCDYSDPQAVLAKVAGLAITKWNFKTEKSTEHIGPMAQDFRAAFGYSPGPRGRAQNLCAAHTGFACALRLE